MFEEGATTTTHVYRFVGVEQSLTDARNAVKEERWEDAIAASDALLKQQPNNAEGKTLNAQAKLEAPNKVRFDEFTKAADANEVSAAVRHYRAIAENSLYHERAADTFDKLGVTYVDNQVANARALSRAGRCDEARRVARTTGDWFPDAHARLDEAASGCHAPRVEREREREHEPGATVASNHAGPESKAEPPAPPPAPAPAAAAPVPMSAEIPAAKNAPAGETRTLTASIPTSHHVVSAPPPPVFVPAPRPHNVPAGELEKYRIAGDRTPNLPAGARMIAHRDGVKHVTMAVKFCVSEVGVPTSATYVKSSDYNDANEQVLAQIRKWRFRPYVIDGRPTPVCTATLLNYLIE